MSIVCINMSLRWRFFIPHLCILLSFIQILYYCIIVCTIQFYNDFIVFWINDLYHKFGSNFTANELRLLEGLSFCWSKWSCSLVWSVSRTHKNASDWSVMILGCPHSFLNFMERTLGEKNIYYNNINFVYWRHVFDCLKSVLSYEYVWLDVMIQNG